MSTKLIVMDAATITTAALDALDDVGLDRLSMRAVAARLGVQVGGLYYYLPDKSALLRSMANDICRAALADFEATEVTGDWDAAARALCHSVRGAIRSRRDAARVLATGPLNGSVEAMALMERLIGLLEHGIAPSLANDAADTLMSYVTGFVLQEQMQASNAGLPASIEDLQARFPRVFRAAGADNERTFGAATATIIDGFVHQHTHP
jgi:TetR/AcrR family transcriptional regulator, tetracycline repressor protein